MSPETRYAKSGDTHIAYQVIGDGPIDLVFVMGWISHLDYFWEGPSSHFLARLASFSRLIVFDKRGTGLSDRVVELPTIEQRMDDVRAVMDAVGSHRAALLGISEGAAMCALFAATYPERTVALVIYGAYATRLWHPDYPWAPTPEQRQEFLDTIEQGWGGVVDLDTLAPSTIGDESFREWWASYLQRSASPGAALALAEMNSRIDIRHVLPAIHVPTLILHRTGDLDIDVGGARYMAERIPGAKYVELKGNDHLVFAGDQDAVLAEIEQFLTGTRPAPESERVLATILLVELVGAVAVAARLGDSEWQTTRQAFGRVVGQELMNHRGREVRRTAAGLIATFDGPARGVRCATAIIDRATAMGLDVRAGMHSGECELTQDGIRGVASDIAARVLACSDSGDVTVSSTIPDLVAGSGITFEPIDRHLPLGTDRGLDLFRIVRSDEARTAEPALAQQPSEEAQRLSPREREVAALIGHGRTNREIAADLSISIATVERHTANIFSKLNLHSRSLVAVWAVENGILADSTS